MATLVHVIRDELDLAGLGLSAAARNLLPKQSATIALVAAFLADALSGDQQSRCEIRARLWPVPRLVSEDRGSGHARRLPRPGVWGDGTRRQRAVCESFDAQEP